MRAAVAADALLDRPLAERAHATARLLATRIADPEHVTATVAASPADPNTPGARLGSSLLAGDAGLALVLRTASRALPESAEFWARSARARLATAVRSTRETPVRGPGIGYGTAGLALVVSDFAADEPRYGEALDKLHSQLLDQLTAAPPAVGEGGVRDSDYDAIHGSAGVLGHLVSVPAHRATLRQGAHLLIDHLVQLCLPTRRDAAPNLVIPPRYYPLPEYLEEYPHGYVNLGLAHGLAGPLAALSLAWRAGYRRKGLATAIQRTSTYLCATAVQDEFGVDWPTGVPLGPDGDETPAGSPARAAWCYGAPGITSALLQAAHATGDDRLREFATTALEASLRRIRAGRHAYSATLCHGLAGVLAITAAAARSTRSASLRASLPWLTERVVDTCHPDLPFGVRNSEPHHPPIDNPDLLVGAAGVAAALWSVSSSASVRWQRCLLIA
ncbi:lanthionine synthetase C family protein [Streptomyces sp. URMC 124]|uniref:lanthionine synthetase C family protein n=1 Tax=Streptomyces sp. URMC 124 TaxID=3423405 RepID=UPI003F1D3C4B